MKLKSLDQMHISSVKADSLRPGEDFTIGDEAGKSLLAAHPGKFVQLADDEPAPAEKAEPAPGNKAAPTPSNKAAPKAAQKAAPKRGKPAPR